MAKLYIVPTPIGNLDDITLRAIKILGEVDLILCEDTRRTKKLTNHIGVKCQLQSHHKFNEHNQLQSVIHKINNGSNVALVSDAGTPGISDPGKVLVNECLKENINVTPLPGPSAVTTALSVSGFSEKYLFFGFFPEKEKNINNLKILLANETTKILHGEKASANAAMEAGV